MASARSLWRIDPGTGRVTGSIPLGHTPQTVTVGKRSIWVATDDGLLLRVDPRSRAVTNTIPLGFSPILHGDALAVGGGAVWAAVSDVRAQPARVPTS
jgi:DNA-binding beta-propeller fold protein YncE